MKRSKVSVLGCLVLGLLFWGFCPAQEALLPKTIPVMEPPGSEDWPVIREKEAILINGRILRPAGQLLYTQSYNWGMAVHPQKSMIAVVNRDAVQFISMDTPAKMERFPPYGIKRPKEFGKGSYMGCAFSPDGSIFYMGDADNGRIIELQTETGKVQRYLDLNTNGFKDSFPGDFRLGPDGQTLYVLDQFNYRLVAIGLASGTVRQTIPVGRNPFALRISPDGRFAWVCHVGLFEYPLIPDIRPDNRRQAGISFPAYGFPSPEMEQGTTVEGKWIPGLGSPNHPDAMAVFQVNLKEGKVERKIKTGYPVGADHDGIKTTGGAHPAAVVVGNRNIYISNAGNDCISAVNVITGEVEYQIPITLPGVERLRGILPFGMALSPNETKLYVACAGANAVAVIDLNKRELEGWIPAGWFCNLAALSADGSSLYVSSAKGMGSGPNGGRSFTAPIQGTHPGDIMRGLLQVVPLPDAGRLAQLSRQVWQGFSRTKEIALDRDDNPVPPAPGLRAGPIEYIVFIVKENRTFDQVYGQRAGVRGDPSLADLGMKVPVVNKKKTRTLRNADVSPNHQALADRFALSDNFYCDSDQSNTGHRWVAGVYPNEWVEVTARSRIEERLFSSAPGRRYVNGSSAVVLPEDYNEAGAMWEHLSRHHISFFNFGLGTEMPASLEEQAFRHTGIRMSVSFPLPQPLFDHTSRKFATYNMAIPDQYRVDMFAEEFRDRWGSGRGSLPKLITMVLPNDHLTEEHPADGYPFRESYMADNDLALGRIVHQLSRTEYWKKMLIIVTEDDPQGGRDHVEAHRSILLMISPFARRGYVSHLMADFSSIMKLIFTLLDLPPLNQFDATASMPRDLFTAIPDYTPYTLKPADQRIFDPDLALKPFDHHFNWKGYFESPVLDDPDDMRRLHQSKAGRPKE